jgi:hypothetical protein
MGIIDDNVVCWPEGFNFLKRLNDALYASYVGKELGMETTTVQVYFS